MNRTEVNNSADGKKRVAAVTGCLSGETVYEEEFCAVNVDYVGNLFMGLQSAEIQGYV